MDHVQNDSEIVQPMNGQQRSLWFLREIAPGTEDHGIAIALRFRGELDIAALEYALDVLVTRQGAFSAAGGTRDWLDEHDAGDLGDAQLAERLERAAQDASDRAGGPLLRVLLYRRAQEETVVLVVAHHSIADFWSITAFVREFEKLYAEQTGGQCAPLPELTDFVRHYWWIGGSRVSTHAAPSSEGAHHPINGQDRRPSLPHR
jgi:Condensation domain